MRRFIAMHESESGFDSPAAVIDWIAARKDLDEREWRVVEILVDPVTETFGRRELAQAREQGYTEGVEMVRKLMRLQLGLAVPSDSA